MTENNNKIPVYVELAEMTFDNIDGLKAYLALDDYNATATVLRIAAASGNEGGISEAKLSEDLGFKRATMNRIIRRLIDTGHIKMISETRPRRYQYNFKFAELTYGKEAENKRRLMASSIINRVVSALLAIFWIWQDSQFDKDE